MTELDYKLAVKILVDIIEKYQAEPNELIAERDEALRKLDRVQDQMASRTFATVYERAAWQHDTGQHRDSTAPVMYCPRCEIEHPSGRLAYAVAAADAFVNQATAERDAAHVERDEAVAELAGLREKLKVDFRNRALRLQKAEAEIEDLTEERDGLLAERDDEARLVGAGCCEAERERDEARGDLALVAAQVGGLKSKVNEDATVISLLRRDRDDLILERNDFRYILSEIRGLVAFADKTKPTKPTIHQPKLEPVCQIPACGCDGRVHG